MIGDILFFAFILLICINESAWITPIIIFAVFAFLLYKIEYSLLYWYLYGHSVWVCSSQYPEIYNAVKLACEYLGLRTIPSIFVLQGHGRLELYLVKKFTARGYLVFTSDLVDKLLYSGDSRELMMIIGQQLGHIKLGHYKMWVLTDVIGKIAFFFYTAWKRRCHYSADRVGFLVTGSLEASRKALLTLTAGKLLSNNTNIETIREQDSVLRSTLAARFFQLYSENPYMIHRIIELESFETYVRSCTVSKNDERVVAALPQNVSNFQITIHGQAIVGDRGIIQVSS